MKIGLTLGTLLLLALSVFGQTDSTSTEDSLNTFKRVDGARVLKEQWYQKIRIGGYGQVRYNKLFETNPDLKCEQCDKNWGGEKGGFSLRRMRLKVSGQIGPRVYLYFQADFASTISGTIHSTALKDAYMDLGLDDDNEFRIRLGQSKIPYGFENMQSSSQRLPLDRNDGINSALKNERDLAGIFYWARKDKRELFRSLSKQGLKHSGDYGCFALGIFNGQTANIADQNNTFHVVTRFTYPIEIGNQVIEPGIQAYTGKYVLMKVSPNVKVKDDQEYLDQRVAASFVLYPQPFGIQAEYNIGRGPEYNKLTDSIEVQNLHGGYITASYMIKKWDQRFIPFTRAQYYDGGKKHELDARSYNVKELEMGIEWHPNKNFELVAVYVFSERRFEDHVKQDNLQRGRLMRFQAQVNF